MHHNVEGAVPLATASGSLTAGGQAFKDEYEALTGGSSSPAPTPTPTGEPGYSFEDGGTDGWSKTGNVSAYGTGTDVGGQDGTHALKATFFSSSPSDLPYLHVNPASGPEAGQTLSAYVYLPAGTTAAVTAKLYVQDPGGTWHTGTGTAIGPRGSWVRLSYSPSGYTGAAKQVGVQFSASPVNTAATVHLDSVTW